MPRRSEAAEITQAKVANSAGAIRPSQLAQGIFQSASRGLPLGKFALKSDACAVGVVLIRTRHE